MSSPPNFCPDDHHATKLLLDLGNCGLYTVLSLQDYWGSDSSEADDMYLQFSLILSDVSAFLVDVIERCGIARVNFSRLMQVAKVFQGEVSSSDELQPWNQSDFEGWLSMLTWKGVGNREAVWQRRYICLVGPFLYILENPESKYYKQYISLRGKQVQPVPKDTDVAQNVLAVYDARQSNLKGPATITGLSQISSPGEVTTMKSTDKNIQSYIEKLFITGVLDELRVCVSYCYEKNQIAKKVLLGNENQLFEFRAIGGQVELSIREDVIYIGTLLKSLEIVDQYQFSTMALPRYLARSFIQNSNEAMSHQLSTGSYGQPNQSDSEDKFFEASDELDDVIEFPTKQNDRSFSAWASSSSLRSSMKPPSFSRISGLLPSSDITTAMTNTQNNDTIDSFVKAQLLIYSNGSPDYHNLDNRVVITLATLSFYCYRPTILAILEFVDAINVMENAPPKMTASLPCPILISVLFSENDEDYNGYDYSLTGNLSELFKIGCQTHYSAKYIPVACGDKNEISAVRLDIMTVKVEDINLTVGTGRISGESIIQDVSGLSVTLQRSLRDLLHQVPATEAIIQINAIKAALSNKEYEIITECAISNISEIPRMVPSLGDAFGTPKENIEKDVSPVPTAMASEDLGEQKWITIKVLVSVEYVELSLHSGITRDSPLASLQARGAWILYKSNLRGDGFLFATLKGFSVIDVREGIKEELRLAIGKSWGTESTFSSDASDTLRLTRPGEKNVLCELNSQSIPSMLILDATFKNSLTNISLCVQRPKLLVVLDFLLAISEFFVPSLRSVLSDEEEILPLPLSNAVIIDQQIYFQPSVVFSLSPLRPLLVDDAKFEHFIYDGKGGKLFLQSRDGRNISKFNTQIIIHVGDGKRLQFKNVTIVNGHCLDNCVFLGSNSSYSASEDDKVYFKEMEEDVPLVTSEDRRDDVAAPAVVADGSTELVIELQAIGPELTFYNASEEVGRSFATSNKAIHAYLDAFLQRGTKLPNSGITNIHQLEQDAIWGVASQVGCQISPNKLVMRANGAIA
ncbi:hypothetical protein HPP92_014877 [Vanilla planifolia]|uniref:Uncharacterized protein n=1 Tax=Vanilla planifolia TaxID=51239 RepID=A0A835UUJ4_VANPL|nr:hypothetical protein HPP92_014877 [Vanilla planifolia]